MEMNLFLQLAEYLNFSWALVELKEPRPWGTRLPNNTVVGGLAQAIRENADVAFSNYWQRLEYLDSMDFGPPLNEVGTHVLHSSNTFPLGICPMRLEDRF